MKLHTKAEYKEKVASEKGGKAGKDGEDVDAALIVKALGAPEILKRWTTALPVCA